MPFSAQGRVGRVRPCSGGDRDRVAGKPDAESPEDLHPLQAGDPSGRRRKVCLTISSDAETDPALLVEKRCCGQTVSLLRQVAEKDLTFSETMSLSLGREGAAELLHCRANGIVTETKAIGNKLIFKGSFWFPCYTAPSAGSWPPPARSCPFTDHGDRQCGGKYPGVHAPADHRDGHSDRRLR